MMAYHPACWELRANESLFVNPSLISAHHCQSARLSRGLREYLKICGNENQDVLSEP